MKLKFTPQAITNIRMIASYIRQHNPVAAEKVRVAIYRSLRNLLLFPNMGRRQDTEGVRKLVVSKYPYVIYYSVDETAKHVIILSIRHQAEQNLHSDA